MLHRTGPTPRPGYTLIELLVVVLIIAVLAALTTAAVVRVSAGGKRVTAVSEISQLDVVLTKFKQDFGFYPPSHVVDTSTGTSLVRRFTIPNNVNMPEYFVLKRMFGGRWNPVADPASGIITAGAPDGAGMPLDPNQCLVYFLAGPAQTGWDPNGPFAAPADASNRKGPYFEFQASRLLPSGGLVPRYADPWGVPYAYFSSNAGNDSYDPRVQFPWVVDPAPANYIYTPTPMQYPAGFAQEQPAAGSFVAHPYRGANGKWLNPGKYQIISAGPDQAFGAGSFKMGPTLNDVRPWIPGAPGTEYISSGGANFGYDDIANFNGGTNLGETGN
jgi:prepilin-type N-terminal cleavage/methylation domain-containing protein